jgi:RNA polymerase sigma-70 factor (ECF subfamily)
MISGALELEDRGGDEVAAARSAQPSPAQAAALYETYAGRLRRYVAFRVREPADVDDLTADVFRRAMTGPMPVDPAAWPAWIFRVAHNAVVDHYRRQRFPDPIGLLVDRADEAPTLPELAIRNELVRAADAALRTLPGRQRAAVYLRHYEGLEYEQVAAILGVPETTARSLVHRGLRSVARELDRREVR